MSLGQARKLVRGRKLGDAPDAREFAAVASRLLAACQFPSTFRQLALQFLFKNHYNRDVY